MELLRYDFSGDLHVKMEAWEREVKQWEKREKEKISEYAHGDSSNIYNLL